MRHSQLECDKPLIRDKDGKLPYDVHLRVFEPKKKKLQSFSEAAMEMFGSGSSATSKQSRGTTANSSERNSAKKVDEEVTSPLKTSGQNIGKDGLSEDTNSSRKLFEEGGDDRGKIPRKRKSNVSNPGSSPPPDLNALALDSRAVVPKGLVSARVNQLHGDGGDIEATTSDELTKKQK